MAKPAFLYLLRNAPAEFVASLYSENAPEFFDADN
jgi:hypothetical protein